MTSRLNHPESTLRVRTSLVQALNAPGDNKELVAQRARRLLQCKPSGVDRDVWLQDLLPEGDTGKVLKALRTVNGGGTPAKSAGRNGQPGADADDSNEGGRRQQQRGRHPKRHRRT